MQHGDLETQSVVDLAASVEKANDPAAVESLQTGVAAPSASDALTVEVKVTAKATLPPSRRQRLTSGIGTLWRQLREQRREAAAVVVLIVMAMFWFDTGKSGTGAATNSPDPLDTYDAVLSDFEPVGNTQPMRESADPFESGAQSIRHRFVLSAHRAICGIRYRLSHRCIRKPGRVKAGNLSSRPGQCTSRERIDNVCIRGGWFRSATASQGKVCRTDQTRQLTNSQPRWCTLCLTLSDENTARIFGERQAWESYIAPPGRSNRVRGCQSW